MLAAGYQLDEEMREPVNARDFVEIPSSAPDHSPHRRPDVGMVSCIKPSLHRGSFIHLQSMCFQPFTACSKLLSVSAGVSDFHPDH